MKGLTLSRLKTLNAIDIQYYYSRLTQEVAYHTHGAFSKPTDIILLMTNHCNARCVHCKSYELPSPEHEMTTNEWMRTLAEIREWLGPVYVYITGGEALLRRDMLEILEHAVKLGLQVEFLSNGFPITEGKAEKLIKCGLKRITISLDGANAEIHNATRGRNNFFERVNKALTFLVHERDNQNSNTEIHVKTTIMSLNVNSLGKVAEYAKQTHLNGITYQALEAAYYSDQLNDDKWYQNNPLWVNNLVELDESIVQLKKLKSEGYPIQNSFESLDLIQDYFHNPDNEKDKIHSHDNRKKNNECRTWVGDLQIIPDGGMKMCHWMKPFANARDGNLKLAWKNRAKCWKSYCEYL